MDISLHGVTVEFKFIRESLSKGEGLSLWCGRHFAYLFHDLLDVVKFHYFTHFLSAEQNAYHLYIRVIRVEVSAQDTSNLVQLLSAELDALAL